MCKQLMDRIVLGWIILMIIAAILGNVSFAATKGGETSGDFLQIGVGARAAAMGGAFSAVTDNSDAAYWNPAGLASVETYDLSFSHFSWYQDIAIEHGAAAFALSDRAAFAASVTYLNYGDIDGYDADGVSLGAISAYDWAGALSLGFDLTSAVQIGVTGKYINQKLDQLSATAFAADLGVRVNLNRISLAAVATNIGTDLQFNQVKEKLPAAARIGVAVDPFENGLIVAMEYENRFYGDAVIRNGIEYGYQNRFFLRTGYSYFAGDSSRELTDGLTMGAGLKYGVAQIDYAFSFKDNQSNESLHRFSVRFGLK
jgi:uncharacterized membrane protein YeaQ/YmgE (transglycosylase-associated protein family)